MDNFSQEVTDLRDSLMLKMRLSLDTLLRVISQGQTGGHKRLTLPRNEAIAGSVLWTEAVDD